MRRRIGLLFVGALFLAACGQGSSHNSVSMSAAISSALAAVETLDHYRATTSATPAVTGFTVVSAQLSRDTSSVSDSNGNVLTVSPPPREAWVVDFTAPPQTIWSSVSAVAEVDSTTGVVAGSGLWAVPAGRPVKDG